MSQRVPRYLALAATLGIFLGGAGPVQAVNVYLEKSGDWNVSSNGSPVKIPGASDDVCVADAEDADLDVAVPSGVSANSRFLTIGNIGDGAMTISGGTLNAVRTTLGALEDFVGTVTMTSGT